MDRELLHHAVHGSGQHLKSGLLLSLNQVLPQPVRLLLGLGEFVGESAPIFSFGLTARFANSSCGRFGRTNVAFLNAELFLLLDQLLQILSAPIQSALAKPF
jgi:hypothetical protein